MLRGRATPNLTMAEEEEEEERTVETELELQLHDQRDSLASLTQALLSDPSNSELLSVSEEVAEAIKDAEEGLFQLKRARLLREIDSKLVARDFVAEASGDLSNLEFVVGSKCRFRHSDGRWHNAQVLSLSGSDSAKISFLTPTSQNMLMCKFYLEERCRYGTSCRSFHGIDVPISSLKKYIPTVWDGSLVGSNVLAVTDDAKGGLWREAELESWDDALGRARVVFRDDGSSANLVAEAVTLSEYTGETTDEEEGSGSGESCCSDSDDEEGSLGLGFPALPRGIQKGTAIFAKWENHTRGIASKMMANMGYRAGMGLGASGQGMVDPIPVRVLPAKQSLDHAVESRAGEKSEDSREGKKKRQSRGGKRKRDKKFAVLACARKEKEDKETAPDVFNIINCQLVRHDEARNGVSGTKKQKRDGESVEGERVDRRSLVASNHEIKGLRTKVERLEEMAKRNRREKVVFDAAMRKLGETRTALAHAEAAHASASNQVSSREKEKKWLKF